MNRKNKMIIGGIIALLLVAYLVWSSFATASTKNISVESVAKNPDRYAGQQLRLTGKVAPGTIKKEGKTIKFEITEKGYKFPVVYNGGVPNSFQDNAEVIADGNLSKDKLYFEAKSLIVRCPSKYTSGEKK